MAPAEGIAELDRRPSSDCGPGDKCSINTASVQAENYQTEYFAMFNLLFTVTVSNS